MYPRMSLLCLYHKTANVEKREGGGGNLTTDKTRVRLVGLALFVRIQYKSTCLKRNDRIFPFPTNAQLHQNF